jgi:hypothetical protein
MTSRVRVLLIVLLAGAASFGALYAQAQKKAAIAFPTGYRKWLHVKTMYIYGKQNNLFDRFGGLHNVYVNGLGTVSLQQGRTYPEGSMLVMEVDEGRTSPGAVESKGRKALYVMKKNAKLYPATGGWGFEVFQGYQAAGSLKDMKQCFDCHSSQKTKDYVYSYYVE